MKAPVTVAWQDRTGRRGKITIDVVGLRVDTGSNLSPDLTDVNELIKVRNALNQLLISKGVRG